MKSFYLYICVALMTVGGATESHAQKNLRLKEDEALELTRQLRNRELTVLRVSLSQDQLREFNLNPCGPYFMVTFDNEYDGYRHDSLVTKIMCRLDSGSDGIVVLSFLFRPEKFVVEIDDTKQTPTARFVPTERDRNLAYDQVIVRISRKHYEQSPCLPEPSNTRK